ncbi:MAG TPA: outer membrane beta-barrel protein [Stellaceae bacterium]|jgi:hypothetical protein
MMLRAAPMRIAVAVGVAGLWSGGAMAQVGVFGGPQGPTLTAPAISTPDHPDPFAQPSRDYSAMVAGDWLLYPTIFAGALFDSNPSQSSSGAKSSAGARLVPSLLAETTNGISKTTIYGMADAQLYTNQSGSNSNTVAARAGFIENYQFAPDLVFNGQGDFTRQRDLFSTFGIDHAVATPQNPTGIGLAPVNNPLTYNQYSGSATLQKNFNQAFVSLGGSVIDLEYDHASTAAPSPNGVDTTETVRGGYWINPVIYGYVEGSVDQRNYSTSILNSSGYRVVGGLGSDQIGLVRGEVYAGYQAENYNLGAIGTVGSPVYGARLYYYPLPELTLSGSVDESLGVSFLTTAPGVPAGAATRVTTSLGQATYALMQNWSASSRFGFIHTDYAGTPRNDDAWTVGATLNYSIWRNVALTLDYQHIDMTSNVALQGFTRDVATVGLTYKY